MTYKLLHLCTSVTTLFAIESLGPRGATRRTNDSKHSTAAARSGAIEARDRCPDGRWSENSNALEPEHECSSRKALEARKLFAAMRRPGNVTSLLGSGPCEKTRLHASCVSSACSFRVLRIFLSAVFHHNRYTIEPSDPSIYTI